MKLVLQVIGKGAAQSWQMDNRGGTMVDGKFDFGFAVDWMRKDLGLCLDEARNNGAPLPVAALVDQFYAEVQAMGWTLGHFVADPTTAENEVTAVEAGSLEGSLEALRPTLLAIARMQLRNETWAEDVVSETFVAALEGSRKFAGQSQLKTWVVGILKHKIIDFAEPSARCRATHS